MAKATKVAKSSSGLKNEKEVLKRLNELMTLELSGVTRYLHYSFMIVGPNRIPVVSWFRAQANEALAHATLVGEKITSLGGHPTMEVEEVPETNNHNVIYILKESLEFEKIAVKKYHELLPLCTGNIALEEMIREFCKTELEHLDEVNKMIGDH
ncbi:MAG: ferritin-like domain-containing protein [Bacteriovoracaceae bacterium]